MTVLIGMFLLGLFIALGTWTVSWSNHVKRELVVKVYFKPQATTAEQENDVRARCCSRTRTCKPGGIKYVSKEQALENMKKRYPELVKNLTVEPAPRLARGDAEQAPRTSTSSTTRSSCRTSRPVVDRVSDGKQVSHRILQVRARDRGGVHDRDRRSC